jgi:hypothetical protein
MPFDEVFQDDLSVSVGNPTKAKEYNDLAANTDAVKQRFVKGHHFNNTGVDDEDGFHKGDYSDPLILMAKSTGNGVVKYCKMWIDLSDDTNPQLRIALDAGTAAPANATGGMALVLGAHGANNASTIGGPDIFLQ